MSRFYVGQRVRIKWSRTWPQLAGMAGVITGTVPPALRERPECEWLVTPDGYLSERLPHAEAPSGFYRFAPSSDQLEPATDSYDVTRDTCVWKPEHLRVEA